MIDPDHDQLSVRRQCELLGVARAGVYYQPVGEGEENRRLMRLLDEQYTRTPFYGVRRMTAWLYTQGYGVDVKRVRRLLRLMGLEAIYPKPRLSQRNPEHKIYPYLLRDVTIDRVNQVWSTDITYVPLAHGWAYLVAVMDWHSRYVLSWELSNTLDAGFCCEALDRALQRGRPEIFNTDQGSQFTSREFTGRLEAAGVKISMDGRGRCLDNVFVERLWRSVKYEDIYVKGYERMPEARRGLSCYFALYNDVSYYPTSLCGWKLNVMLFCCRSCGGPQTASHLPHDLSGRFGFERVLRKHPRSISQRMQCRNRTAFHGSAQRLRRNPQKRRRFGQIHPSVNRLALRRVTGNLMRTA